jgi:hypothetical protein
MTIESAVGMSIEDVHVLYERDGWTWYQPFSDYRIVFNHLDGRWVRYYTSLHEDGIERVDGIDNYHNP